jgi:hypothetical protein
VQHRFHLLPINPNANLSADQSPMPIHDFFTMTFYHRNRLRSYLAGGDPTYARPTITVPRLPVAHLAGSGQRDGCVAL